MKRDCNGGASCVCPLPPEPDHSIEIITRKGTKGISSHSVFGTLEECLAWLDKQPDLTRKSLEWLKKNGYES